MKFTSKTTKETKMTNQTETQKYLAAIEEAKEKVSLLMQYLNELEQHEKHYEIESYDVRETTRLKDEITNVCTSFDLLAE